MGRIKNHKNRRSGQAIVLLLGVIFAILAMVYWMMDIHTILMTKLRLQDGGDAAVLSAARWQAAGLNLVGEINLLRAFMLVDGAEPEAVEALLELQQRVMLTTPFLAILSAQETAEANRMREWPRDAMHTVQSCYEVLGDYGTFENYHEGAKSEYQALVNIFFGTSRPIYAMPYLPLYESPDVPALLVTMDFYEAILSRNWCWFKFAGLESFLRTYSSPKELGPLPHFRTDPAFSLYLSTVKSTLVDFAEDNASAGGSCCPLSEGSTCSTGAGTRCSTRETIHLQSLNLNHQGVPLPPPPLPGEAVPTEAQQREEITITWVGFDSSEWRDWSLLDNLPLRAEVKPQYDYKGCASVVGVWHDDDSRWLAAAKPFGAVGETNPIDYPIVLGGFDDVRLVPIDAVDKGIEMPNPAWLVHIQAHIGAFYYEGELPHKETCRFCKALNRWQSAAFRMSGVSWLRLYGHTCRRDCSGGPSETGGTNYAH